MDRAQRGASGDPTGKASGWLKSVRLSDELDIDAIYLDDYFLPQHLPLFWSRHELCIAWVIYDFDEVCCIKLVKRRT